MARLTWPVGARLLGAGMVDLFPLLLLLIFAGLYGWFGLRAVGITGLDLASVIDGSARPSFGWWRAVWFDSRTVVVFDLSVVVVSGWALYLTARQRTTSRLFATALLFAYLSFAIHYFVTWSTGGLPVLTSAALAWFLYAWHGQRWVLFWSALGVGMLAQSGAALLFAAVTLYLVLHNGITLTRAHGTIGAFSGAWRHTAGALGVAIIWFLVGIWLGQPADTGTNAVGVPPLVFDWTAVQSVYAFAYLPLLSPFTYFSAAAVLFADLLPAPVAPRVMIEPTRLLLSVLLAAGAVFGAETVLVLMRQWRRPRVVVITLGLLSLMLVVSAVVMSWL